MNDRNNRVTENQLDELLELIEIIDPENKVFDSPKTIIKKRKYGLMNEESKTEKIKDER